MDDKLGLVDCSSAPSTLTVGASFTCTATHTVTQDDLNDGSIVNTARAAGRTTGGDTVSSNFDTARVTALQSSLITLVKAGSPRTYQRPGDQIAYTFTVKNIGNVALYNVTVSDPMLVVSGGPIAVLQPGEEDSATFTGVYAVTQADVDAGTIVNIATATADNLVGGPVSATDGDVVVAAAVEGEGEGEGEPPACCAGFDLLNPATWIMGLITLISLILSLIFGGEVVRPGKG